MHCADSSNPINARLCSKQKRNCLEDEVFKKVAVMHKPAKRSAKLIWDPKLAVPYQCGNCVSLTSPTRDALHQRALPPSAQLGLLVNGKSSSLERATGLCTGETELECTHRSWELTSDLGGSRAAITESCHGSHCRMQTTVRSPRLETTNLTKHSFTFLSFVLQLQEATAPSPLLFTSI